jgi:nicotinamidase-related amidase
MSKRALILIDMQRGFADPAWGSRNNPELENRAAAALAGARGSGWPVLHVKHNSVHASSPLRPAQLGNEFMECVQPKDGERIFEKTVNSAFIGTDLQAHLVEQEIDAVVLGGLTSDHCVSTTARMAANLGFDVTILADATATFERRDPYGNVFREDLVHSISLASLDGEFAKICTVSQLFDSTEAM